MCKVLKVPRSSYYRWLKDPEGQRKRKYMELDEKIRDAYFAAKGRNGSLRLAKDLQVSGTAVSRTTVACHTLIPAIRMTNKTTNHHQAI